MANPFFEHPILNSPYACPQKHWELNEQGQPTQRVLPNRRPVRFITPIPQPRKRNGVVSQPGLVLDDGSRLSTAEQQYELTASIEAIRGHVARWRTWPRSSEWQVTPETARLLQHWRRPEWSNLRPFFCHLEAVEAIIWLTKVAPKNEAGKGIRTRLKLANEAYNPGLFRIAIKMATGAGKTTVMAMLIAWQTVNAVRHRGSKLFTSGFLVVAPGITVKDRLRVLQPNDPDSYYPSRELVPADMLADLGKAKIVITNYHAFKLRERLELSAGGRALLQGRGEELDTRETEGQMLQRVMPDLMGLKNIIVLNDEAHHCYREKPDAEEVSPLVSPTRERGGRFKDQMGWRAFEPSPSLARRANQTVLPTA